MKRAWLVTRAATATLLGLLGLALALLLWSLGDSSLATALTQVARWLPAGHSLQVRDAQGALAQGGRIGWLRWQHGALRVEASDVQIRWEPAALLRGELLITQLAVGGLRIDDQRPPEPDTPALPPGNLALPLKVRASVQVDALEWAGSRPQHFGAFGFEYVFDSYQHILNKGYSHILSNKFTFSGQLQASDAMALGLKVEGQLSSPVPGSTQALTVAASAELKGQLAGRNAQLALQARLQPLANAAATAARQGGGLPLQAQLSAQLAPWQAQKVVQAQGQWQGLNLAELWPQLPQTRLAGHLSVQPKGDSWQASVQLHNALVGALDQQRLPLQDLQANFNYGHGQWLLQTLQAQGAGGSLSGDGQVSPAVSGAAGLGHWQAQLRLKGINPAAIDTRWPTDTVSGSLTARNDGQGIGFVAQLQGKAGALPDDPAASAAVRAAPLQLLAQGVWSAPSLSLSQLRLDAGPAHLQGQLSYHTHRESVQGQIKLALPGLRGTFDGQWARADGAGTASLDLSDAALAWRWLARWPFMARFVGPLALQGHAQLNARWQGGWHDEARDLSVTAQLRAPQLDWQPRASAAADAGWVRSRALSVDLAGQPGHFSVQSSGEVDVDQRQLSWRAQLQAGQGQAGAWQAQLQQLDLRLRAGQPQQLWQLALGANTPALSLNWLPTKDRHTLTVSAGTATISGPMAGNAQVQWQPLRWTQARPLANSRSTAVAPAQWQSQGQIDGLPLAWVDLLGGKTLVDLGLGSDLVFAGSWDAEQADTLHASLLLERRAGDLRLLAGTVGDQMLPAGMRETRLQLNLDGDRLAANLRWDSARAGHALLAFSTQLQRQANGWSLPGHAPVGGSLQLDLPPMEAWSALAPPGWRLRGTMNTHINLEGTLDQPQWSGTLQAQDLAVRSVVDGIDFSQGRLQAQLTGQQLEIAHFTLRGAGATGAKPASASLGGVLEITGTARWLPAERQLQLQLQAQAQALRLSSRPERRISVSGKLSANLQDRQLTLRGALVADQALLTLPEDSAPQLGNDVVVRHAAVRLPTPAAKLASSTPDKPRRLGVDVQIDLDPGKDFQVRGMGVATRLVGRLTLSARAIALPTLSGTLRTVGGSYRAYGQLLDIERGLIRFSGPADNPALTILAIRPKLSQRVGVQITGTALAPHIALYAEPDLPEAEKLGWLLLGRSPSADGAESALLQQAAMALLDKNGEGITAAASRALGLDEISFSSGGTSSSTGSTGSDGSAAASVTLGKRLSKDFYIAYESSFNGALGILHIFYDLSKNLTLRAQTGEQSAIDLIYTLRYD